MGIFFDEMWKIPLEKSDKGEDKFTLFSSFYAWISFGLG